MTTPEATFERAIAAVLRVTPNQSPSLLAYIDHIRTHAQISARADESKEAFEEWERSMEDSSTWFALSEEERQLFNLQLATMPAE